MKGEGRGGFDLWYIEFEDGKWQTPRNFGSPVNSTIHDSYPALSPDGNQLYFTRCETIDASGRSGCKIFVAEKKRGRIKGWEAPVELDSKINTGNSSMPRLLSDNKTLISMVTWIIALIAMQRGKNARWWVLAGSVVQFLIYIIPHSVMGSELNYNEMDAGTK